MGKVCSAATQKKREAIMQAVLCYLRSGATRKDAAAASGITYETLRAWMRKDSVFSVAVTEAEGECAVLMSTRIYQEATRRGGSWRAALEWLKRRRPEEWGDNRRIDLSKLSNERLIELLAESEGEGEW